jgi:hypothetical protein
MLNYVYDEEMNDDDWKWSASGMEESDILFLKMWKIVLFYRFFF